MSQVGIKSGGNRPAGDGDINLYESPELRYKKYFNRARRAIFVNGMDNSPKDHKMSADALSTLQACPVVGVFNKTDGKFADLVQCLTDKLKFVQTVQDVEAHKRSAERWNDIYNLWKSAWDEDAKGRTMAEYVESMISGNPATVALYRLLRSNKFNKNIVPIFAHSQGNLITSNALTAVALADGISAISGRVVNSFGSPCRFWPPGIEHRNHAFTFDGIGWMDYKFSFDNIKVGNVVAHGYLEYMKYDPEWVINRFRWGSFGFTANLDENGLANAMKDMGNNPRRLHGIFKRLNDAHWSDKDDVTLLYVQKMRAGGKESMLRSMARSKPDLIDTMVECLVGGTITWNTAEEKKQAEFLKSLV